MRAFHEQAFAGDLADRLSLLYVAITRARSGLHLLFRPFKKTNPGVADSLSPATFLRGAIPDIEASLEGKDTTLPVPIWKSADSSDDDAESTEVVPKRSVANPVRLRPSAVGGLLTPSSHDAMPLRDQCRMVSSNARRDGVILHELFRAVGWIEDGVPGDAAIGHAFDEAAIQLAQPVPDDLRQTLRKRFEKALAGTVSTALHRDAHAAWNASSLDVLPEHPMLVQLDDGMLRGRIDRLVLGRDASGAITNAAIIDYKSGKVEGEAGQAEAELYYAPQLYRYAMGVAAVYGLDPAAIETQLLFVD
jgi:ATP-dependent exoDNAse (exonuclease V) beta subunit